MVLARCEWGHDDYSLNVANLPMAKPEEAPRTPPLPKGEGEADVTPDLFGDGGGGGDEQNLAVIPADYAAWLAEIKTRVTAARQRGAGCECGN